MQDSEINSFRETPNLEDLPPPLPEVQPLFFPVSLVKLFVMSIVTFGCYQLYWFYKNWSIIKWTRLSKRHITPLWRASFGYFFCYSLFKEVESSARKHAICGPYFSGLLAAIWIGLIFCDRLPEPCELAAALAVMALLPAQMIINEVNTKVAPSHAPNRRFSAWNIVAVVLGGLCWVFSIIGMFMQER